MMIINKNIGMAEEIKALTRSLKTATSIKNASINQQTLHLPSSIVLLSRDQEDESPQSGTFNIHNRFVLCVCLRGQGILWADSFEHHLFAGEAILIFPWQAHARLPVESVLWEIVSFEMPETHSLDSMKNKIYRISETALRHLLDIQHIYRAHFSGENTSSLKIFYLTGLLMLELLINCEEAGQKENPKNRHNQSRHSEIITKVCTDIYKNYRSGVDMTSLAGKICISESHLRSIFKKHTGVGVGHFLAQIRMSVAKNLLSHSNAKITEIAEQCGFGSLYSFSRAFKKQTGLSPLGFRNSKNN